MLETFIRICRFNFGEFEKEELKKFLHMGLIFALMIGAYWTLKPLKDSIFVNVRPTFQLPTTPDHKGIHSMKDERRRLNGNGSQ